MAEGIGRWTGSRCVRSPTLAAHRNVDAVPAPATAAIDQKHGDGEHNHKENNIGYVELHDYS